MTSDKHFSPLGTRGFKPGQIFEQTEEGVKVGAKTRNSLVTFAPIIGAAKLQMQLREGNVVLVSHCKLFTFVATTNNGDFLLGPDGEELFFPVSIPEPQQRLSGHYSVESALEEFFKLYRPIPQDAS